jgi:DNA-binding NarL/FixJ family response regulator
MNASQIRVLLVDDNAIFRETLRKHFEAYPNIELVGEAEDGDTAVVRAGELQPTVVVMDISMARMDGITATRVIRTQNPRIAVAGLTVDVKDYHVYAMEKAGAFEVLKKDDVLADLYSTLQRAVASVQPVVILDETPSSTQAPRDQEHAIELNPAEPAVDQSRGDLIHDEPLN